MTQRAAGGPIDASPRRRERAGQGARWSCNDVATSAMRRLASLALVMAAILLASGCRRQHYAATGVELLPYPVCDEGGGAPETLFETVLVSGALDTRMRITERFRLERRPCKTGDVYAAVTHQEWPVQIADLEVLYDASWKPLRAWRRWMVPGSKRDDGDADTRVLELRTNPIGLKRRTDRGVVEYETLRSALGPEVVLGQGRANLTVWLQKEKLAVGQKVRRTALDLRSIEKVELCALERRPDMRVEALGRDVRVYTFFGRETIFADEYDRVVGDLAGLVSADLTKSPLPPPIGPHIPADPAGTP